MLKQNVRGFVRSTISSAVDSAIGRLGYIKAADVPGIARILYAGEGNYNRRDFITQTEAEMQKLAVTNPRVYSNIMLLAERIALAKLMVEAQDSKGLWKEIPNHDFTKIMEQRPNPYMGQTYLWMYQMFWLLLQGECYWMQVPDKTGSLAQVYPLPANRLEPAGTKDELIAGFWYYPTNTGNPEWLERKNVIFNRLPNPFDYNRGLSPLSPASLSMQIDQEARKFDLEDYRQGLTLRTIVSMRPEVSDPDALRYQRELDEASRIGRRFMLVRAGDIKTAPVTVRRDASSEHIRKMTNEDADYIYGIPGGYRDSSANRANAEAAERTLADTLWPLMLLVSEDMTVQSVMVYYNENERARFEDPRKPDREMEMKEDSHRWEYLTYNEVREGQGLDPYFDEEIGQRKFTVADELIKIAFEAELAEKQKESDLAQKESDLNDREAQMDQQTPDDEGLEGEPEPEIPDAFLEDEETKSVRGSELMYWLESGQLPSGYDQSNGSEAKVQETLLKPPGK